MTAQDAWARPQAAKLTVEDFLLLGRSGAFAAYAKTELIDGKILVVNAQFASHYTTKTNCCAGSPMPATHTSPS